MRVENWNPNALDETFENVAIERLVEAAGVVADHARRKCPVGTVSRPIAKTGRFAGQVWTSRDAGRLKKSIRVVQKKSKAGKPLTKKRNVRVYAGHYTAYYAQIVEYFKPFLRPSLAQSTSQIKSIIGAR
jgi:hypothetical protein